MTTPQQTLKSTPLEMRHHSQITEEEGKIVGARQAAFVATRIAILSSAINKAFTLFEMPPPSCTQPPETSDEASSLAPDDDSSLTEEQKQLKLFEAVKAKAEEKIEAAQAALKVRVDAAETTSRVSLDECIVGKQYLVIFTNSASVGSRKHVFKFWDAASLALEMYATCQGFTDIRKDQFCGGWLYMAGENPSQNPILNVLQVAQQQVANRSDQVVPPEVYPPDASSIAVTPTLDLFWSMILYFHSTGSCFPVGQTEESEHIVRSEMCDIVGKMQAYTKSMMERGEHKDGDKLPVNVQSKIAYVIGKISRRVECPAFVWPSIKARRPRWWTAIDFFWTDSLQCFSETGKSQCPFGLKAIGCWNCGKCELQHPEWAALWEGTAKELQQPLHVLEQMTGGPEEEDEQAQFSFEGVSLNGKLTALQQRPGVRSCVNPSCATTQDSASMSRCSRCRNVVYCSGECQKVHWKIHKPACREATDEDGKFSEIWAVVVPGDYGVKPYAVLLPAAAVEGLQFLRSLLRTDDVGMSQIKRGDKQLIHDLRVVFSPRSDNDPNILISALVTPDDNQGNVVATNGAGVRCRGDAVILRKASYSEDEKGSIGVKIVRVKEEADLIDFTMPMFEERFGQFSFVPLGDDQASTIIGPKETDTK